MHPPSGLLGATRPNGGEAWDGSRKSIYMSRVRTTFSVPVVVGEAHDGVRHVSALRLLGGAGFLLSRGNSKRYFGCRARHS